METSRRTPSGLRGRLRFALASSVVDQGLASAVGLVLTVATGRRLGAGGLGSVAFALAVYLVAVGFNRALVLDPLSVQGDAGGERAALAGSCAVGVAGTAVMYALALPLGADAAAALTAFAPWVVPALLVDSLRVAGFRAGKPTTGATAGAVWLVVTTAGLAATARGFGVGDAALSWGAGAAAGSIAAWARLRHLPASPHAAWAWWRSTWPLGRWLALQTVVYTTGIQGAQFALGIVGGPAALGTLKAVQTLFAPLTLLLPAVNIPALPVVARTLRASAEAARSLARRLTIALSALCGGYLAVALAAQEPLTELAFGPSFHVPNAVMIPVALGQLVVASGLGTFLLLKAAGDGRGVFVATAVGAGTALVAVLAVGGAYGATGAAWGICAGAAAAAAVAGLYLPAAVKDGERSPARVRMAPTR
ncbi:MAG: hypothetical protein ABR613_08370 [Actinomycetota bacterium]